MPQTPDATFLHEDNAVLIFSPLDFRHLQVKNRLFRSNLSGMFDEYNGYGGHTRVNWEEKFAKGGVGCIISYALANRQEKKAPSMKTSECAKLMN